MRDRNLSFFFFFFSLLLLLLLLLGIHMIIIDYVYGRGALNALRWKKKKRRVLACVACTLVPLYPVNSSLRVGAVS